jgi:multidrug efflux pump subunit AcrB
MSQHRTDAEIIAKTRNTSRFFVETRHIAWVLLIATCLWGVYGYLSMPQRKDPEVQVRTAVALTPWRGASAEKVEQQVTKKIENHMAAHAQVTKIESISRTGLSVVYLDLDENLNYYNWRDAKGEWQRTRAVTLSAQMRSGEQIDKFGAAIDATLADLKQRLPEDLAMARTSDQPLQVRENIDLFMSSLYEAVILVVIVSLIGFWEWRSAALMASRCRSRC